jgi:hypothetical protein
MIFRELPPEEFSRLEGHPSLDGYPVPEPWRCRIVVSEDDEGAIVAVSYLALVPHLEPNWVSPRYRGKELARAHWEATKDWLETCSLSRVYCFTDRAGSAGLLARLGWQELPYRVFLHTPRT